MTLQLIIVAFVVILACVYAAWKGYKLYKDKVIDKRQGCDGCIFYNNCSKSYKNEKKV